MRSGLSGVVSLLARAIEICLVLALSTYLCLIVGQIVLRYLRIDLLYWSEELVRYLLVWSVLLGATVATHRNAHVRIDILENILPQKPKRLLALANTLILIAFAVVLTWAGVLLAQRSGSMTASMLGIKMSIVYSVVALSGVLDIVFLLARLAQLLLHPGTGSAADDGTMIDTAL